MKYDAPQPSIWVLIWQCGAVLVCAVSLYLLCNAYQKNKNYDVALKQLQEKKFQLNRASKQVDNYVNFVSSNPFFQTSVKEPQWERIDENWVDLPFPTLVERFESLYGKERPFILESFSASDKTSKGQDEPADGTSNSEKKALTFNVQGYYLCPCQ